MSETNQLDGGSAVPWPTSGQRAAVPATSLLPGSELAPPAAVKLLNTAVQGAHETLDRLAVTAEPVARQLGRNVSAAGVVLQEKTAQLRDIRDEWTESARTTVRANPLVSIAAAVALGALIARLRR